MKNLENLSPSEKEFLLKFPAYISLLAANNDLGMSESEKEAAINFSHIKTFSHDPMLHSFYQQADKEFKQNITDLDNQIPKDKNERESAIQNELAKIETILGKLEKDYAAILVRSMTSFKNHVSKAHHSILEYFIFPIPIKGLT